MIDFENRDPIDHDVTVLDLLCKRWSDCTTREINRWHDDVGPYVEIGYHHDFSDSQCYRFKVTHRVVDDLLAKGYVVGRAKWGYTDMKELLVSPLGEKHLWSIRRIHDLDDRVRAEYWYERRRSA